MNTHDPAALRRSRLRWKICLVTSVGLICLAALVIWHPAFFLIIPVVLAMSLSWFGWGSGRRAALAAIGIGIGISAVVIAIEMKSRSDSARVEALRTATESKLTTRLSLGDDFEKIEQTLHESGLEFTYSDVLRGYYASIPAGIPDCRIDVVISVTKGKQLLQISVKTIYIGS